MGRQDRSDQASKAKAEQSKVKQRRTVRQRRQPEDAISCRTRSFAVQIAFGRGGRFSSVVVLGREGRRGERAGKGLGRNFARCRGFPQREDVSKARERKISRPGPRRESCRTTSSNITRATNLIDPVRRAFFLGPNVTASVPSCNNHRHGL